MTRLLAGSQIVASHRDRRRPRAGRLLAALRPAGRRRRPRHARARRERSRCASSPRRSTTRSCCPTAASSRNGNFHGAPVAYVLDFLAIAAADLASISERRTDRMLDATAANGLPPFLADDPGVDSGHMIAQYTQAGIVSEIKRLAAPASVDSIPSSAMQEDHVSMGWSAARKLRRSVDGLTRVLAIEVLTAARALDLRAPLEPGAPARARRCAPSASASRASAPTATSPPRSRRRARACRRRRAARGRRARHRPAGLARSDPLEERARTRKRSGIMTAGARPVRAPRGTDADRRGLAAGSRAAHAHEQPRPRGRRAPRRPRRLRRHRQGRARLGVLRRARAHAHDAQGRRDDARAVGQPGRRHAHPRVGAARDHRQLQPRARLGDVAGVPPARAPRPDDVRPDDRRLVDLHRHPGHRAGHLRDVRRRRRQAVRRHAAPARSPSPVAAAAWAARSRSP